MAKGELFTGPTNGRHTYACIQPHSVLYQQQQTPGAVEASTVAKGKLMTGPAQNATPGHA